MNLKITMMKQGFLSKASKLAYPRCIFNCMENLSRTAHGCQDCIQKEKSKANSSSLLIYSQLLHQSTSSRTMQPCTKVLRRRKSQGIFSGNRKIHSNHAIHYLEDCGIHPFNKQSHPLKTNLDNHSLLHTSHVNLNLNLNLISTHQSS